MRLLEGYARALWRGGYASLLEELKSEVCLSRKEAILQGDTHAGFPWPREWEEQKAREALLEEFQLEDPWTFRGREKRVRAADLQGFRCPGLHMPENILGLRIAHVSFVFRIHHLLSIGGIVAQHVEVELWGLSRC